MSAVTGGRDALGEVTVLLELDGRLASGQGVSTDILEASGRAYLRALSNALAGALGAGRPTAAEEHASAAALDAVSLTSDFTWVDGERLIRFGAARSTRPRTCSRGRGLRRLRAADDRARGRGARRRWSAAADGVLHVPAGQVAECRGRGARSSVEDRAAGGARRRARDRRGEGDRRRRRAARARRVPTTLSGAEMTPLPPHAGRRRGRSARAPGARGRRSRPDGVAADAASSPPAR